MAQVNGMSVGRDYAFAYYDVRTGVVVNMGDVIGVKVRKTNHRIESRRYNDTPRFGFIPGGYEIDFDLIRVDPDIEDFQLAYDTVFNAGGDCPGGFLNETVSYSGGLVRTFQYVGFVFAIDDVSDVSREKNITSRGKGMASDKKRIS